MTASDFRLFIAILLLCLLFMGDPDLWDAIIKWAHTWADQIQKPQP